MPCENCDHLIGYHATHPEGRCTIPDCSCDGYYHDGVDLYAEDKKSERSTPTHDRG